MPGTWEYSDDIGPSWTPKAGPDGALILLMVRENTLSDPEFGITEPPSPDLTFTRAGDMRLPSGQVINAWWFDAAPSARPPAYRGVR